MVPTKEQYNQAIDSTSEDCKKLKELYHLKEVMFKDLTLSVDCKSKMEKITFWLIKNCKDNKYPKGNCQLAWII